MKDLNMKVDKIILINYSFKTNIMTPKKRAIQLMNKMTIDFGIDKEQSRLCAIVCIEEILDEVSNYCGIEALESCKEFYDEVLDELHKL